MQLNLDFQKDLCKTICWIASVFSWLLFLITGWIGYFALVIKDYDDLGVSYDIIWSFINVNYKHNYDVETEYSPIRQKYGMIIVLFIITYDCGNNCFCPLFI
jgi:hypothetical protein